MAPAIPQPMPRAPPVMSACRKTNSLAAGFQNHCSRFKCYYHHKQGTSVLANAIKKILLIGETWMSSASHYKGVDQFGSVTFHSGADPLVRALLRLPACGHGSGAGREAPV